MPVRIAHFSDTHLGYESYPALSVNGNNQRGEDVVRAFRNVVRDIIAFDPDIVIHSGDVLDRPRPDIRYMYFALQQLRTLTRRPDGTLRPVVVLAGNHEQSRNRKEVCWLELLSGIDGLWPVSREYTRLRFPTLSAGGAYPDALDGVVVHAIPHDSLKTIEDTDVEPVDGATNILVAHGVASGSELFLRSLGREYAIQANILERRWDYAALGHWHKQGPVTIGPGGPRANIWYAGSTENMGFGDLRDNGEGRGYLQVVVERGMPPDVNPVSLPVRAMFRLPAIDATGKTAEALADELVQRVSNTEVQDAVVGQIVTNVPRDLWSLVDTSKARAAASKALFYEITVRYEQSDSEKVSATRQDGAGLLDSVLAAKLANVPDVFRERVATKVQTLVAAAQEKFEET